MQGPLLRRDGEGTEVAGPALGLVETSSIARGLVVADQMVKKAPVALVLARPVSPGKHLVLVTGEVADVGEAMRIGLETAAHTLVDSLELAQVAPELLAALSRKPTQPGGAVGIFETFSVASTLLAADAAAKAAEVTLCELRLADGLGGKAYFILSGAQADVEAGLYAAETAIPTGLLLARELIARPHDDLLAHLRR
ncbi:MAG TPA: BMC domain-containing protein [Polyangia bacterium]